MHQYELTIFQQNAKRPNPEVEMMDISALQLRLISAAQCRDYTVECERLGKAADISIERATALISMAHSWDQLAEDMGTAIAEIIRKLHATGSHPTLDAMRKEIPEGVSRSAKSGAWSV
jgi:hypothetical protein